MDVNASDIVPLLGALGIGSFIGQYLIGAQTRRQLRSQVLAALESVESARWAGNGSTPTQYAQAMHELETAALVARIPRIAVTSYKVLASVAQRLSQENYDEEPDPEYAGGILSELADPVRAAAGEISRLVWTPWLGRVGLRRRLRKREALVAAINDPAVARILKRVREYVV